MFCVNQLKIQKDFLKIKKKSYTKSYVFSKVWVEMQDFPFTCDTRIWCMFLSSFYSGKEFQGRILKQHLFRVKVLHTSLTVNWHFRLVLQVRAMVGIVFCNFSGSYQVFYSRFRWWFIGCEACSMRFVKAC